MVSFLRATAENPVSNGGVFTLSPHITPHPQIPVFDLAYELVLPEKFIGECVSTAMDIGFLTTPKRRTFGGKITPKGLRRLKQVGR